MSEIGDMIEDPDRGRKQTMSPETKCPLCGAKVRSWHPDSTYFVCMTVAGTDGAVWNTGRECLERQLAQANETIETIEKLPKFADTGKPFVIGRDVGWILADECHTPRAVDVDAIGWGNARGPGAPDGFIFYTLGWDIGEVSPGPVYSTEAAAKAASSA